MLKIGITGGIGSGKTFICKIFELLGIPVYYADARAKTLMYRDKKLKAAIKALLGGGAYHRNGRLNRAFVAEKIFADKSLLNKINALVHPSVGQDFIRWADMQKSEYVLEESAIIYEANLVDNFDAVIVVFTDQETQIARVIERDKLSRKQVLKRINSQVSNKVKMELADFIILNDGN